MGIQVKFKKSYPSTGYDVEATVCSYEVTRKSGIVQIWSGLLPSRNPMTASNTGLAILSGLEEPLGLYYKENNWVVDKKIDDVDYMAIYKSEKMAT